MADYESQLKIKTDTKGLSDADKALAKTQASLKKTAKEGDNLFKAIDKSITEQVKSFKRLSTVAGGLAGVLAGVIVGATAKFIRETSDAQKEMAALESVIASTGGVAGFTAKQVDELSNKLSRSSIFSAGEINAAAERMLTYSDIVGEEFPRAMQTAVDWSARYGQSLVQSAETIGKAIQKPSDAAAALSRQGFKFSKEFVKELKELERQGKLAEAQIKIFEVIEEGTKGAAEAMRNTFAGATAALKNSLNDMMTGKDGSLDGAAESINKLAETLQSEETRQAFTTMAGWVVNITTTLVDATTSLINFLAEASKLRNLNQKIVVGSDLSTVAEAEERMVQLNTRLAALRRGGVPESVRAREADLGFRRDSGMGSGTEGYTVEKEINYILAERIKISAQLNSMTAEAKRIEEERQRALKALSEGNKGGNAGDASPEQIAASKKLADERKRLLEVYQSSVAALQEQVALYGVESAYTKMMYKVTHGDLRVLNEEQKNHLLQLAEELELKKAIKKEEDARAAGVEVLRDYDAQILSNENALAAIANGTIRTQEQLNRFLADEAYWRDINKRIQEGSLQLTEDQIEKLKEQRAVLVQQGEEFEKQFKFQMVKLDEVMKDGIIDGIGSAFDRMFDGVSVGFDDLIKDMTKKLAKSMLMNYLMNGFGGGGWSWGSFQKANGFAMGGAFNNGIQFFANGGVVSRATAFGMAGGGMGVMGEAGPEAILPLTRGPNGKLGVQSHGGASIIVSPGAIVVNASKDSEEDARKTSMAIKQMIDMQIGNWMKNAQRPGGILNSSFGQQRY